MNKRSEEMKPHNNQGLKELYQQVYSQGKEQFFSRYVGGLNVGETDSLVLGALGWQGKVVMDVGCGSGRTIFLIANAGAKQAIGIDYAEAAIREAESTYQAPNLSYSCGDFQQWTGSAVDCIVSCGTLEHTDSPKETLRTMERLIPTGGHILLTCPHFLNIRGFVWMTLQTLLNVPMSLTDLHFISPFDMRTWIEGTSLRIVKHETCDQSRANASLMLTDLRKRLHNALRDAKLDNQRVNEFIDWLSKVVEYRSERGEPDLDGATALYLLEKA